VVAATEGLGGAAGAVDDIDMGHGASPAQEPEGGACWEADVFAWGFVGHVGTILYTAGASGARR